MHFNNGPKKKRWVLIKTAWFACVSVGVKARSRYFFDTLTSCVHRLALLIRLRVFLSCLLDWLCDTLFLRCSRSDWRRWHRFDRRLKGHNADDANANNRRKSDQIAEHNSKATRPSGKNRSSPRISPERKALDLGAQFFP